MQVEKHMLVDRQRTSYPGVDQYAFEVDIRCGGTSTGQDERKMRLYFFFLTIVVISGRQKMWYPPRWERSIQSIFLDWGELVVVYGKLHPVLEQQLLRPPLVDEIQ